MKYKLGVKMKKHFKIKYWHVVVATGIVFGLLAVLIYVWLNYQVDPSLRQELSASEIRY